jgi:hypothetical protein
MYSEEEDHYDVPALIGSEAKEKREIDVGLVKSTDWKYERELRCFLPNYDHSLTPEMRVMEIAARHHEGIVLGPKMSFENKKRALAACHLLSLKLSKKGGKRFAIFQARQSNDRFNYDIEPLGFSARAWSKGLPALDEVRRLNKEDREYLQELCNQITDSSESRPS